jgi:GDP-mannose transporter
LHDNTTILFKILDFTTLVLVHSFNHFIESGKDLNLLIVVFQALVAVICVETCQFLKWIEPYPRLNKTTVIAWAPVNIFFCAMLFTGMASLQHNSVPMVTVFKNITNLIIAVGDYFWFGTTVDRLILASFAIMLGGALAAAWNDLSMTFLGFFWMACNCVSTAGYVLYMKFATQHVKISKFGMVYVNNVLCAALLLPVAMMQGQMRLLVVTRALHSSTYFFQNIFAGTVGFFLNFASLNCVQATGPTTYAIVGSLNKVPVTLLGYFMFDNLINRETWICIVVSLTGGFIYSFAKLKEESSSSSQQPSKTVPRSGSSSSLLLPPPRDNITDSQWQEEKKDESLVMQDLERGTTTKMVQRSSSTIDKLH